MAAPIRKSHYLVRSLEALEAGKDPSDVLVKAFLAGRDFMSDRRPRYCKFNHSDATDAWTCKTCGGGTCEACSPEPCGICGEFLGGCIECDKLQKCSTCPKMVCLECSASSCKKCESRLCRACPSKKSFKMPWCACGDGRPPKK